MYLHCMFFSLRSLRISPSIPYRSTCARLAHFVFAGTSLICLSTLYIIKQTGRFPFLMMNNTV